MGAGKNILMACYRLSIGKACSSALVLSPACGAPLTAALVLRLRRVAGKLVSLGACSYPPGRCVKGWEMEVLAQAVRASEIHVSVPCRLCFITTS